ncbi:anoctamin-7-like isoform X2 [Narcine bancroftii]|uniref:anoctamin-7-like isoform X2 n=1 Tax=Narcine bancroftii TaxID=1343680 RepID=UPI003831AA4C
MERTGEFPRIDFVLSYKENDEDQFARERMEFLREVTKTGLRLDPDPTEQDGIPDTNQTRTLQILKIYAPFHVLSKVAEKMRLKMPLDLEDTKIPATSVLNVLKYFETDNEEDYFSAPYRADKQHLFKGIDDKITFFRPAVRSLIVNHILNDIHIHIESHKVKAKLNDEREMQPFIQSSKEDLEKCGERKKIPSLPYLLMKKAFTSAFTLHEGSEGFHNSWTDLNKLWAKTYRLQPLWKIRNYFGEKIAFYFAVMELLLLSLIPPSLFGLAVFGYGLYHSVSCNNAISNINTFLNKYNCSMVCSTPSMVPVIAEKAVNQIRTICDNIPGRKKNIEQIMNRTCAIEIHSNYTFQILPDDFYSVFNSSFDNCATPIFGLIICLWGTVFLELWKRRNAELVYEWDVDNYESDELVRPEFYGTEPDPITGEPEAYYSTSRQRMKFVVSFSVGVLMVGCVFISVLAVVTYKTWARFRVTDSKSFEHFLLTTVVGSLLNAISISILGKVYQIIAFKMTEWENHRTQTDYSDALIIKLFAFQFANSYSPLFYIAFLRTNNEQIFTSIGLPGLEDNCGVLNNCMIELSFQVLTLMITEPLPKFFKDVILPSLKCLISRWSDKSKELSEKDCSNIDEYIFLQNKKPDLGDFTLQEYTRKVIQYGYQMVSGSQSWI